MVTARPCSRNGEQRSNKDIFVEMNSMKMQPNGETYVTTTGNASLLCLKGTLKEYLFPDRLLSRAGGFYTLPKSLV